ncbi:uncharacterized protein PSFLO_02685 [Pseudozyma flocculosa]|uniref:Uncharacterized protein n=1 Tax=Pseudozyma flocculosa TaxID=84751 RepID=A0A5C3EY72_9BASI|nr:uncharacterized protein PSFLO_02685 [Pseudozyma flocculosa]
MRFLLPPSCSSNTLLQPPAHLLHPCRTLATSTPRPVRSHRHPAGFTTPPHSPVSSLSASATAYQANPRTLVSHLDAYVIGQQRAKKVLAVGVWNHYLRVEENEKLRRWDHSLRLREHQERLNTLHNEQQSNQAEQKPQDDQRAKEDGADELTRLAFPRSSPTSSAQRMAPASNTADATSPATQHTASTPLLNTRPGSLSYYDKSNILLLGPSGSGKTLLLRTLAESLSVPFIHVDATPLTMAGYVGEDVESIVSRLLVAANGDVERAQRGIVCLDEVDKLAKRASPAGGGGRDVGGEGVQQALLRLLEGCTVSVPAPTPPSSQQQQQQTSMSGGSDAAGWYAQEQQHQQQHVSSSSATSGGAMTAGAGGASPTVSISTQNVLFVLSGAFVGIEDVIQRRLGKSGAAAVAAAPSSTALLAQLEPSDLEAYGLIPEFIGRLPLLTTLAPLSLDDLVAILQKPKNALLKQYTRLFASFNVELIVTPAAVRAVARRAKEGNTGARGLRRILDEILLDPFYISFQSGVRFVVVDRASVEEAKEVGLYSRGQKADVVARVKADSTPPPPAAAATRVDERTKRKSRLRNGARWSVYIADARALSSFL